MSLRTRTTALAVVTLTAMVLVPQQASATQTGANGRIAFSLFQAGDEIYSTNPDGSDLRQLTSTPGDNFAPAWSPSTGRIAFSSTRDPDSLNVYTMNADGTNQVRLTGPAGVHTDPEWSPDGGRIVYVTGQNTISVMNADGTNKQHILATANFVSRPDWSPTGTSIAFSMHAGANTDIYRINADGTGLTRLTDHPELDQTPSWSPDGTKLAFGTWRDGHSMIYSMNADGSAETRLTNDPVPDYEPEWSPDGKKIAFRRAGGGGVWDMWVMNPNGSGQTMFSTLAGSGPAWQSVPTLTVPGVSAAEGTTATVTVALNRKLAQALTVTVTTNGGTADAGLDYQTVTVTRTFSPQSTTVTVTVQLLDDAVDEQNETIGVTVFGATVAPAGGTVTIVDNDPPPQISVQDVTAAETGNANVLVRLDRPSTRPVTVTMATVGGTATPGVDYQPIEITWTFPPLGTTNPAQVPIVGDTAPEPDETIGVTLSNPVNATIGDGTGTVTIADDDTPRISVDDVTVGNLAPGIPATAVVTVRLNKPATQPVTVDYETADDTATGGVDYVRTRGRLTFPQGAQTATVEVRVTSDGDAALVERFLVGLSDPVGGVLADTQGTVTLQDCVTVCEA
ncbi:Calx-beta domain-containing protein [Actinophytocola sp.]|uniref:Calx-beta domain-containing protein n=1 Tax=Actinophytocola sp. TaxID=1872138 RepID=UPI002ED11DFE